ncbi:MAG: complex I subunit 5 family protein [Bradymonadaceae bacterium]
MNITLTPLWLLLCVLFPAAVAVLFAWPAARSIATRLAPWTALPAVLISVTPHPDFHGELSWLLMGMHLGLDEPTRIFLFLTAWVWFWATFYARRYVTGEETRHRFLVFFLVTMSGNLGLIFAQDMLSYLLFFAVMSLASYGLIVHRMDLESLRAGKVYITLVIIGEVVLFSGALFAWALTGSIWLPDVAQGLADEAGRNLPLTLFFLGFGIKAGVLPLHIWLPLAHPAAPTPASAVLSGTMIKAGLLGWLRFMPIGLLPMGGWGRWCIGAGLLAVFFGVAIGLTQRNPKTILAYSSISQMGFMTVIVGMGMIAPATWPLAYVALLIYAVHHALAKGSLFLGVGVALEPMRWRAQQFLVAAGLIFASVALAGAPWTTGAIAKAAIKDVAYETPEYYGEWLIWMLSFGAVGTALLMTRFLWVVWPRKLRFEEKGPTRGLWVSWATLVVSVALVPWVLPWEGFAEAARHAASLSAIWSSLWPLLLAAIIAVAGLGWGKAIAYRPKMRMPAGDLIVPTVWLLARATWGWYHFRQFVFRSWRGAVRMSGAFIARHQARAEYFSAIETRLRQWATGGLMVIVLGILLIIALAVGIIADG